ncbi:hypothetical protein J2S50_000745 [Streptomyces sp. DSM 40167]|nr:hypothetical protein [Streptomyces sp. DSM 40167]
MVSPRFAASLSVIAMPSVPREPSDPCTVPRSKVRSSATGSVTVNARPSPSTSATPRPRLTAVSTPGSRWTASASRGLRPLPPAPKDGGADGDVARELAAGADVEVSGGFVGEDHVRLPGEGTGHGDALLPAAREFGRPVVEAVAQSDDVDQRVDPLGVAAAARQVEREGDVLGDGQRRGL